jgi:transposase
VRLQRDTWQAAQPTLDPARLVFIDETGLDTAMVRRYGWDDCGARVRGAVPQGHWHTSTFVAALRQRGLTAPMVIQGAMDGACFKAYVKEFLCPTLEPGDIVVWDNLSSHQVAGVREAIEAVGATLKPLPPCSPDFNPIEQVFAKLKAGLRKAGERTIETLWLALAHALDQFTPAECANDLRGAGYAL